MNSFDYSQIVKEIKSLGAGRFVFVSGKFNTLHPGHVRLLKFAKEQGDFLVVGLEHDDLPHTLLPGKLRLEALHATSYVDYAFVLEAGAAEFILQLKPEIIVKGSEFKERSNLEESILNSYGGTLIFGSGDVRFSSFDLLKKEFNNLEYSTIEKPIDYLDRHNFSLSDLVKTMEQFRDLKVAVIGDVIVDEYVTCDPVGMSQEDPTIVVAPLFSNKFLGGAGIVAAHASSLGAKVGFYSVLGEDEDAAFVKDCAKRYGIDAHLYGDKSRITTLKKRFRSNSKTLLRVNYLKQHYITDDLQNKMLQDALSFLVDADLLVFSDFSYGCLPQQLVDELTRFALKHGIITVADSQSSSQIGDISRFKNMTLVTPTEREIRLAVNDFESGFVALARKLKEKSNSHNIITTLGSEGLIIHKMLDSEPELFTDRLPSMNRMPKDVAGAGDALLIGTSLALATGADIWKSAYLGSLIAACQVGRMGNVPVRLDEIEKEIYMK